MASESIFAPAPRLLGTAHEEGSARYAPSPSRTSPRPGAYVAVVSRTYSWRTPPKDAAAASSPSARRHAAPASAPHPFDEALGEPLGASGSPPGSRGADARGQAAN